jgi:hypothetical protein
MPVKIHLRAKLPTRPWSCRFGGCLDTHPMRFLREILPHWNSRQKAHSASASVDKLALEG